MKYYSLNRAAPEATFKEAVIKGIAPDKGLYFPVNRKPLAESIFDQITKLTEEEIGFLLINQFVNGEIPDEELKKIIKDTLCFDFPLVSIFPDVYSLELFHGPTMAFKDVGARFMARCLSYFNQHEKEEITVLVATSGDTGGAVASGFLGVDGVKVVILYPSKKVSKVQEKQLTTLGQNITALEVNGTFDDCQAMVKNAFMDHEINDKIKLTSANSINVARWLPQMFYFAFAYRQLQDKRKKLAVAVPSGNFGNICAGMMAQQLGLPIDHFIAATNSNKVVPDYLETGNYIPEKSVQTISNAMDVGDPSNFIRIQQIYSNDLRLIRKNLSSYSYSDHQTRSAMKYVFERAGYILDPHGAVGYLGLESFRTNKPDWQGIFLETAHPVKFLEVIEPVIKQKIAYPPQIEAVINKTKKSLMINEYNELMEYLMNS